MRFFLFPVLSLCLTHSALSGQAYGNAFISEVISIYDGDTFRANIQSFQPIVGRNIGIRINGIDTPEIRGQCLKEKMLAEKARQLTVKTLNGARLIELKNMQRGKYFRIVADVFVDGVNLGNLLVRSGLAVLYDGGKKVKNWCD